MKMLPTAPLPDKYKKLPECTNIIAELGIYSVPTAAALWCGIPANEVDKELALAKEVSKDNAIFEHPYIPCLKPKCILLHAAITSRELPASRENGIIVTDPHDRITAKRRYVSGKNLREYISTKFPDDKPAFLFSEAERKPPVDLAEYQRMTAEYTKIQAEKIRLQNEITQLKTELAAVQNQARDSETEKRHTEDRLEKAKEFFRKQQTEIKELQTLVATQEQTILDLNANRQPNDRTALLNIITALKETLIDKGIFENQAAVIDYLNAEFGSYGLSESNLRAKFAEANRAQKSN